MQEAAQNRTARIRMARGKNIYLWTGEGAGKTSSALGIAMRCVGHNMKVVVVQFLKGRKDVGEYRIMKKLRPYYEIHQFGRKEFIRPLSKPAKRDRELARKGLEFARRAAEKKPRLLVLDEINLACAYGILDTDEVVDLVKHCSRHTIVYMTGRKAPQKLRKVADFVNRVDLVKAPDRYPARRGIEW